MHPIARPLYLGADRRARHLRFTGQVVLPGQRRDFVQRRRHAAIVHGDDHFGAWCDRLRDLFRSMHRVTGSISANTGARRHARRHSAVAPKVNGGTMTSSPGPMRGRRAKDAAPLHEFKPTHILRRRMPRTRPRISWFWDHGTDPGHYFDGINPNLGDLFVAKQGAPNSSILSRTGVTAVNRQCLFHSTASCESCSIPPRDCTSWRRDPLRSPVLALIINHPAAGLFQRRLVAPNPKRLPILERGPGRAVACLQSLHHRLLHKEQTQNLDHPSKTVHRQVHCSVLASQRADCHLPVAAHCGLNPMVTSCVEPMLNTARWRNHPYIKIKHLIRGTSGAARLPDAVPAG